MRQPIIVTGDTTSNWCELLANTHRLVLLVISFRSGRVISLAYLLWLNTAFELFTKVEIKAPLKKSSIKPPVAFKKQRFSSN